MSDDIKPTAQEKSAWAKVPQEFNDWWNSDYSDESNPFRVNSAAYWAWAGWSEAVRLNAQAVPDGWKLVPVDATDEMVKVGDQKTWVFPSRECWAAMLSAAPAAPQPAQPLTVPDAQEKDLLQAIQERDAADDYIDALLDEVLGTDRPEWSSDYGHADAMEQVRETMGALMKPCVDKAWDRFQSSVAPAAPGPAPAEQPLIADEICDAWEFITGHQIAFGPSSEGRTMYLSADEVIEFARAIEQAHGIGVKND